MTSGQTRERVTQNQCDITYHKFKGDLPKLSYHMYISGACALHFKVITFT